MIGEILNDFSFMNTKIGFFNARQIIILIYLLIPVMGTGSLNAQNTAEEYIANYNKRIKLERINDVYIPIDLDEAISELNRLTEASEAKKIAAEDEDLMASKLHFNLGRWMQLHWGLEEGSRLSHYFKQKGLSFPDDMMDLLIRCWHRHLNGKPLMEDEIIAKYLAKRKAEHLERRKKDSIIYREIRMREEHRE